MPRGKYKLVKFFLLDEKEPKSTKVALDGNLKRLFSALKYAIACKK